MILVEPRHAGNIGSVARAMKNMGLRELRLVNPVPFESGEAQWLAHGATDILQDAKRFDSLGAALEGFGFIVAASGREGTRRGPVSTPRENAVTVLEQLRVQPVALVFGREDIGLVNDEICLANRVVRIPTAVPFPSINLAQAVMIVLYEIQLASLTPNESTPVEKADSTMFEPLVDRIANLMASIGFESRVTPATFRTSLRRVFDRSHFAPNDMRTIHKVFDLLEEKIRLE